MGKLGRRPPFEPDGQAEHDALQWHGAVSEKQLPNVEEGGVGVVIGVPKAIHHLESEEGVSRPGCPDRMGNEVESGEQ